MIKPHSGVATAVARRDKTKVFFTQRPNCCRATGLGHSPTPGFRLAFPGESRTLSATTLLSHPNSTRSQEVVPHNGDRGASFAARKRGWTECAWVSPLHGTFLPPLASLVLHINDVPRTVPVSDNRYQLER